MAGAGLVVAELQLAEQMELKFERQRRHFVEVERAAMGLGQLIGPLARVSSPGGVGRVSAARGQPDSSAMDDASTVTKGRSGAGPSK